MHAEGIGGWIGGVGIGIGIGVGLGSSRQSSEWQMTKSQRLEEVVFVKVVATFSVVVVAPTNQNPRTGNA